MAIYKDVTIWNTPGVTVLEFGNADIAVASAYAAEVNVASVLMKTEQGTEIGAETNLAPGADGASYGVEVALVFDKAASIDVVIEKFLEAKANLK